MTDTLHKNAVRLLTKKNNEIDRLNRQLAEARAVTDDMVWAAMEVYCTWGQVGHLRCQNLDPDHLRAMLVAALETK